MEDQCSSVNMKFLVWKTITQHGSSAKAGRLCFLRGQQLLMLARTWSDNAERFCQDLKRNGKVIGFGSNRDSITVDELRQLCVVIISIVYGEVPEAQGLALNGLLTGIFEQNDGKGCMQRSQLTYLQALEVIISEWPATLRKHSSIFQQLLQQLPAIPLSISQPLLEALAPLASLCPSFLDCLMAVARKCLVQSHVASRLFGVIALTALLSQTHAGLLSLDDRAEEVASMFEAVLSLPLPLHLKSRVYHAITLSPNLNESDPSAALPCLKELISKRMDRFLVSRRVEVPYASSPLQLSPLSLFEEYRAKGECRVTTRDDLAGLLQCFLALWQGPEFQGWLVGAVLGLSGMNAFASGLAVDVAGAFLDFIRGGAEMSASLDVIEAEMSTDSTGPCQLLPPCDPARLTLPEMLHMLVPIIEAMLDTLLEGALSHCQNKAQNDTHCCRAYMASLELFHVHGLLVDVGESVDVPLRYQPPELQGKLREFPGLRMRSALNFIQLFMLVARGGLSLDEKEHRSLLLKCRRCRALWNRHVFWGLQYAVMSLKWSFEMKSGEEKWWDALQAVAARSISSKALLVLLMELHGLCQRDSARGLLLIPEELEVAQDETLASCVCRDRSEAGSALASSDKGKSRSLLRTSDSLASSFISNADGPLRDRLLGLQDRRLTAQELQAYIVELISVVVQKCPSDSQNEDRFFAFHMADEVNPAVAVGKGGVLDHEDELMEQEAVVLQQMRCTSMPRFLIALLEEMDRGLHEGLPGYLVQALLELYELLLSRIKPPLLESADEMMKYNDWKEKIGVGFISLLINHPILQSTIFKRFVRLALSFSPFPTSIAIAHGVMVACARYFTEWARSQLPSGENVTLRDLPSSSDEEDDDNEEDCASKDSMSSQGAEELLMKRVSQLLHFPTMQCWQAAVSLGLSQWEILLSHGSGGDWDNQCSLFRSYTDMLGQLLDGFMVPITPKSSSKLIANLLPSPVKTKVLTILQRLHGCCRVAASRVNSSLRVLLKLAGPKASTISSPRPRKRLRIADDWDSDDESEDEERLEHIRAVREEDVSLLLAYIRQSPKIAVGTKQWAAQERGRRKDTNFLKRLPSALFSIERCDMSLHMLMIQVR